MDQQTRLDVALVERRVAHVGPEGESLDQDRADREVEHSVGVVGRALTLGHIDEAMLGRVVREQRVDEIVGAHAFGRRSACIRAGEEAVVGEFLRGLLGKDDGGVRAGLGRAGSEDERGKRTDAREKSAGSCDESPRSEQASLSALHPGFRRDARVM